MPIPSGVETVTVSSGVPMTTPDGSLMRGHIRFVAPDLAVAPSDNYTLGGEAVAELVDGEFTITLVAPDATGINPTGWTYVVIGEFTNAPDWETFAVLTKDEPSVFLSDVIESEAITPAFSTIYLRRDGGTMTGDLVLAGDPNAALEATTKQYTDAGDALKLAIANNLSDLANPVTARTNLGLGNSAVLDVGRIENTVADGEAVGLSSGIILGGELNVNDSNPLLLDIGATVGFVVDYVTDPENPTLVRVASAAQSVLLTDLVNPVTWWLMDSAGVVTQQSTRPTNTQRRTHLQLGGTVQSGGVAIIAEQSLPVSLSQPTNQLYDLMYALGSFTIQGNQIASNGANLTFAKTAGTVFAPSFNRFADDVLTADPHVSTIVAQAPVEFRYILQATNPVPPPVTAVDVSHYDVNNVITLIPGGANTSTVQRVYAFPLNNPQDQIVIQYGQTTYPSLDDAVAAIATSSHIVNPTARDNGILLGFIVATKSATDLSSTSQARFVDAAKFSSGSAGSGVADLSGFALLSGSTFTGPIILDDDPATALGAATKQYVDGLDAANVKLTGVQSVAGAKKFTDPFEVESGLDTNLLTVEQTNTGAAAGVMKLIGGSSANQAFLGSYQGAATNAWSIRSDGRIEMGDAAVARDTFLSRAAAAVLQVTSQVRVTGSAPSNVADLTRKDYVDTADALKASLTGATFTGAIGSTGASTTSTSLSSQVTGDSVARFFRSVDGAMEWGSGSATRDVRLERTAADTMESPDTWSFGELSIDGAAVKRDTAMPAAEFIAQSDFRVAHRGSGGEFPEHTLAAYESAVAAGAEAIEVSVQVTADGVLVCGHDTDIERMTGISGVDMSDLSYAALRNVVQVNAKSLLGEGWELQPWPTVKEVLDRFLGKVVIFIEPKTNPGVTPLQELLDTYPRANETVVWKVYYTSPSKTWALANGYIVWAYIDADTTAGEMDAEDAEVTFWGVPTEATDSKISEVVARGKQVMVWSIHRHYDYDRVHALGVEGKMSSQWIYLYNEPVLPQSRWDLHRISEPGTLGRLKENPNYALQYDETGRGFIPLAALPNNAVLMGGRRASVAQAAGTYKISYAMTWDDVPGANIHSGIAFAKPDDRPYIFSAANTTGGYHVVFRSNGDLQLYRHDAGVTTGVQLDTQATELPVNGAKMTFEVDVTPTDVTVTRTDVGPYSATSADTTYRGQYWHLSAGSVSVDAEKPYFEDVDLT